jgi:hypothetical protein
MVRAALALLLLSVSSGCTSVVIIQRSVPTLGEQWRAASTVTVPKDTRQPITVRER